tara:strand:+ start:157 stop:1074 length:918 start_codon:yes stop_codon:yes gene_type:complete
MSDEKKVQKTEESGSDNQNDIMGALEEFNNPVEESGPDEVETKGSEPEVKAQPENKSEVNDNPEKADESPVDWLIDNKFRDDEDGRQKLADSYKNMQSMKDKAEQELKSQGVDYDRLKQLDEFLKENPKVVDVLRDEVTKVSKDDNSSPVKPEDYDILDEQIDGTSSQKWRAGYDGWLIEQGARKAMQYVDDVRSQDAEQVSFQAEVDQLKSLGMTDKEIEGYYGWMKDPENVTTENKVKIYKLLNGQVSKESNDADVKGSTGQSVKEMSKNVSAGAVEGKSPAAKTNFEKEQEDWVTGIMQFSK